MIRSGMITQVTMQTTGRLSGQICRRHLPTYNDILIPHDMLHILKITFYQAGYREGITAGKEAHLQEGFDTAFASVGVPLGRQLGLLRGLTSSLVSFLSTTASPLLPEARLIATRLSEFRLSDIAPRDLEAEQHAREHLEDAANENEEIANKRNIESLEDMMANMNAETEKIRPTTDDLQMIKGELEELCARSGLDVSTEDRS